MSRKKTVKTAKITATIVPTDSTLRQRIDAYMATTEAGFDWEKHYKQGKDGSDDLFQAAINTEKIDDAEGFYYYECGSVSIDPEADKPLPFSAHWERIKATTPDALYRLLYLIRPVSVDFSDMYKSGLFLFRSVDKRFLVSVYLFKYELGLYFYCPKEAMSDKSNIVIAGMPGSDNGMQCTDPDGIAFFEMVKKAVTQEWMVYGGNNFSV